MSNMTEVISDAEDVQLGGSPDAGMSSLMLIGVIIIAYLILKR